MRPAAPGRHRGTSSVWAIPWLLVVILVLLIGLGHEWRRRRRASPPAAAGPTGAPARSPVLRAGLGP